MTTFLILAPYGAFAFLMLVASSATSLLAAGAICLIAIAFDTMRGRSIKLLGAGSALTFAVLGCYQLIAATPLSSLEVKIGVDTGLFLLGVLSLAIGKPFTLQYAREMTEPEIAREPDFITVNYVITSVWVAAFLMMVAANWLLINMPNLPLWSGLLIAFAIRNPVLYFTKWYPDHIRRRSAPATTLAIKTR